MAQASEQRAVRFCTELTDLQCEFQECTYSNISMHVYVGHVLEHLSHLSGDNLNCQWRDCEGFTDSLEELRRHILYHAFHTKIKCYGKNTQERRNLPNCCLGTHGHNMIPELPEPFICSWNNCEAVFENPESFYRHVDFHTESCYAEQSDKTALKCFWGGCSKTFTDHCKLKDHSRCHTQEKVIACPTCGGMFASRTKFLEHIQRQTLVADESNSNMFTCEFCSRKMATERLLRDHMRLHVNHYKCPCCDMTCPTPSALQTHVSYRHSDAKPHACQYCDYRSKRRSDLRKHLETHSLVPSLLCPIENCDYSTRSQSSFKKHIRNTHQGEEPAKYACHLCTKVTTRGNYLTKHLVAKHDFCWPSGHCRFRYHQHTDGFYRLQTVRLESLELSEAVLCENTGIENQYHIIQSPEAASGVANETTLLSFMGGNPTDSLNVIQLSENPTDSLNVIQLSENPTDSLNIIHLSENPTDSLNVIQLSENPTDAHNVIQLSENPTDALNVIQLSENPTDAHNVIQLSENPTDALNVFQLSENPTDALNVIQLSENPTDALNVIQLSQNPTDALNVIQLSENSTDSLNVIQLSENSTDSLNVIQLTENQTDSFNVIQLSDMESFIDDPSFI